jgi:outer membrane protein TolC
MKRFPAAAWLLIASLACWTKPSLAQADVRTGDAAPPPTGHSTPLVPPATPPGLPPNLLPIDLPYALRLVNASNPTIEVARQRVAEAYAVQMQADVLWVPNLWLGGNPHAAAFVPTFFHHDGLWQNARGLVFPTTKSFYFFPAGMSLEVSTADAFFAPRITRNAVTAAQQHARAVSQDIQLDVALAYLDLLRAHGALAINNEALRRSEEMYRYAESAFRNGLGKTGADPNRARTEVDLRRQERYRLQEQAAVASARLAQLLLVDPTVDLIPADQTVLPLVLVKPEATFDDLLATAMTTRPELAEFQALIRVALERWRQEKWRPLLPILQTFFYEGLYGGGGGGTLGTNGAIPSGRREDFIAQVSWEFQNLGFGNYARMRREEARYKASQAELIEWQARVAAEVVAAAKIARQREYTLRPAQDGVRQAEIMWRKLEAIRFGVLGPARQYDPLETLLAIRALFEARMTYLDNVIEFNRAQFRLFWAMGQPPMDATPGTLALRTPVVPSPRATEPTRRDGKKDELGGKKLLPPPRPLEPGK